MKHLKKIASNSGSKYTWEQHIGFVQSRSPILLSSTERLNDLTQKTSTHEPPNLCFVYAGKLSGKRPNQGDSVRSLLPRPTETWRLFRVRDQRLKVHQNTKANSGRIE